MSSPEAYEAIVIGAGQAGKPLAQDLARAGRKTVHHNLEVAVFGTCHLQGQGGAGPLAAVDHDVNGIPVGTRMRPGGHRRRPGYQ